ncbi:MAG TPA: RNA polymerase sigma factor [Candidatus Scybalocola faecavium]|nr:RNA polymerase sigma factor [Candidatus Scybalocola faecavium]
MKLRHVQTAEDLTQETFLRFLQVYQAKDCEKYRSYLYRIARNLCIDFYRLKPVEGLEEAGEIPAADGTDMQATRLALEQAMDLLTEEERELLFLRYTNEVSVGETAKILGISRFALYRREKHALEQLKSTLERRDFYE